MTEIRDILESINKFTSLEDSKRGPKTTGPFYPVSPVGPLIFPKLPSPDYTSRGPASSEPIIPDILWGPEINQDIKKIMSDLGLPDNYGIKDPFKEGLKDLIMKII